MDAQGFISPEDVAAAIRPSTSLVSIMLANNEIGSIEPVYDIAVVTAKAGVLFHCDATQGIGYLAPDFAKLGANLISFSAHKIYGPKGIGALYIDKESQNRHGGFRNMLFGGGQESGRRPGTQNITGIAGFAEAMKISSENSGLERQRVLDLRTRLVRPVHHRGRRRRGNGTDFIGRTPPCSLMAPGPACLGISVA